MNKSMMRMLGAAVISASGLMTTHFWYIETQSDNQRRNEQKPVAYLASASNEVLRKPTSRLIWQSISTDEQLYAGEAIRTASHSEAQIQLLTSNLVIELEPDSVIILEENQGELALNFLEGNLFVRSEEGSSSAGAKDSSETPQSVVRLKSGENTIALKDGAINLSRSEEGKVNLEVLKGKAVLDAAGKAVQMEQGNSGILDGSKVEMDERRLLITSPEMNARILIWPDKNRHFRVQWQPLPGEFDVLLEAGENRNHLSEVRPLRKNLKEGWLEAKVPVGKHYWRLKAMPANGQGGTRPLLSVLMRNQIEAIKAPVPITPEANSTISLLNSQPEVQFRWVNPVQLDQQILEVFELVRDGERIRVGNRVIHERMNGSTWQTTQLTRPGDYAWRLNGYMQGLELKPENAVTSPLIRFRLDLHEELQPPRILFPANNERIPWERANEKGVFLAWEKVEEAAEYQLVVQELNPPPARTALHQEVNTAQTQHKLQDLKPGRYQWSLRSIPKNENIKPSELIQAQFQIHEIPELRWSDGKEKGFHHYITQTPSLEARWEAGPAGSVAWRARWALQGTLSNTDWKTLSRPELKTSVSADGIYELEVIALNSDQQPLARTKKRQVLVAPKPLPTAPRFLASLPDPIQADKSGNAHAEWSAVEGAADYLVEVRTPSGSTLREFQFEGTRGRLTHLLPGQYEILIRAKDQYGRLGQASEPKKLFVPELSDVRAPAFKGVKVK